MSFDKLANLDSREGFDRSEYEAYLDAIHTPMDGEEEVDAMDDFDDVDDALADDDDFDDDYDDDYEYPNWVDEYDGPDEAQEWHDFDPDC